MAIGADFGQGPGIGTPGGWLLRSVRATPWMRYALAAVGLAAAGALSLGFYFGNYLVAVYSGIVVFAAMLLLKAFAVARLKSRGVRVDVPLTFLLWVIVLCISAMLAMGVAKAGTLLFQDSDDRIISFDVEVNSVSDLVSGVIEFRIISSDGKTIAEAFVNDNSDWDGHRVPTPVPAVAKIRKDDEGYVVIVTDPDRNQGWKTHVVVSATSSEGISKRVFGTEELVEINRDNPTYKSPKFRFW